MYDIVIIGAGPAGLTAAIYGARANKKVLVLEALNYGGAIINTPNIENYPVEENISGFDFATKLYNQVVNLGVEVKFEKVVNINNNEVKTNKTTYNTKTIIIATGLNTRKLLLPNEEELIGKGISYCATCDGAFYKEKDVAVVGGGNTALEDALYLSNICNKVLEKDNIEVLYDSIVTKINGIDHIDSIEVNNDKNINVEGLFIAIGKIPNIDFIDSLDLTEDGFIKADELCHTNIENIFVAGDIRSKDLRQLVTATSDGAVAATEAIKYLNK